MLQYTKYYLARQVCAGWAMYMYSIVYTDDGCIPKNYPRGRSQLRFKDVCKRDLKALSISAVQKGLSSLEAMPAQQSKEKRQKRKGRRQGGRPPPVFVCSCCGKDCYSCIGLSSHTWGCTTTSIQSTTP